MADSNKRLRGCVIALIACIALLAIGALSINGRYSVSGNYVFDKWKHTAYRADGQCRTPYSNPAYKLNVYEVSDLYGHLRTKGGFDLTSFRVFLKNMTDPEYREKLFENATQRGVLHVKYDDFESRMTKPSEYQEVNPSWIECFDKANRLYYEGAPQDYQEGVSQSCAINQFYPYCDWDLIEYDDEYAVHISNYEDSWYLLEGVLGEQGDTWNNGWTRIAGTELSRIIDYLFDTFPQIEIYRISSFQREPRHPIYPAGKPAPKTIGMEVYDQFK